MAIAVTITPDSAHSGVQRLAGFSIREDSGASAHVRLRRHSVSGQIIWELALAANESASIMFPKNETIHCGGDGCYVEEVSGSVTGVLFSV